MTAVDGVVYVVDDDASMRNSLRRLLSSVGISVRTFATAQQYLQFPREDRPSCLVLDFGLPDLDGLELQQQLVTLSGSPPIIFLTGKADIPVSVRAMKAGALEFLTKPFRPEQLLCAIRDGLSRDLANRAARIEHDELRRRFESLTVREREVMVQVVMGRLNKQIAAEFGTKESTVKEQRAQVVLKMKAGSLAELVRIAGRLGLG